MPIYHTSGQWWCDYNLCCLVLFFLARASPKTKKEGNLSYSKKVSYVGFWFWAVSCYMDSGRSRI